MRLEHIYIYIYILRTFFFIFAVRMQAGSKVVHPNHQYSSLVDAFTRIYSSEGGLRAFWRGWAPNVQRAALVNLGEVGENFLFVRGHYASCPRCNISFFSGVDC